MGGGAFTACIVKSFSICDVLGSLEPRVDAVPESSMPAAPRLRNIPAVWKMGLSPHAGGALRDGEL